VHDPHDEEDNAMFLPLRRRRSAAVLALVACVMLPSAGCGSDEPSPGPSPTANPQDATLVWVRCMRSHGVDVPEDPNATGYPKPPGGAPALQAAQDACRPFAPPKMQNGSDAAAQDRLLTVARCLRARGLNVPDPQPGHGLTLPPGSANDTSAQAAVNACMKPAPSAGASRVK
jgi:hypothetical protein